MLIKSADDQSPLLAHLERQAESADPMLRSRLQAELRARRAGLRGEAESAHLIDFHFGQSKNWAVIHDLRLESDGQVAQIDHLLINRWMECYVLESKHFHAGVRINEDGEFERWNDFKRAYEGMPSPLLQNSRHIDVLKKLTARLDLPTRLGLRIPFSFETLILVSPSARISRPKKFDTSRVIKADHLKERIWKDIDNESAVLAMVKTAAKLVASETVERLARELAAHHRPLQRNLSLANEPIAATMPPPSQAPAVSPTATHDVPTCKKCSGTSGKILYGQYGYYFKCAACDGNTAIRFTCKQDHKPRLRKQGDQFFRDCDACGTSHPYFQNVS